MTLSREPAWRRIGWQLFVGLPFVLCAWALFLYLGWRARRFAWIVAGLVYLALTVAAIVVASSVEHGGLAILPVWLAGLVHGIMVKPAAENRLEVIDRFRRAGAYDWPRGGRV